MADIFDVVADATRRDILSVLLASHRGEWVSNESAHGEISVSEIVTRLELSQPTVSKHLKVLREAGLVHVREKGQHRYYQLDPEPLEEIEDWVIGYLGTDVTLGERLDGLNDDAKEFASSVGRAFADTSHAVSGAARRVTPRKWRKE